MNKTNIAEKVVAGLIVASICFLAGAFAKNFYFIEPFQQWFYFTMPNYRTIYPNWKVTYPNKEFKDEKIEVHQRGPKIWGEGYDVSNYEKYEFTGQFTSTNNISFHIKSSNSSSGYNGVGVFQLGLDGKTAEGYVIHLFKNNENPVPTRFILTAQP